MPAEPMMIQDSLAAGEQPLGVRFLSVVILQPFSLEPEKATPALLKGL